MRTSSPHIWPRAGWLGALVCLALLAARGLEAQSPGARRALFDAPQSSAAPDAAKVQRPQPKRERRARLRLDVLAADGSAGAPEVDLNLFDDTVLAARVERFESRGPGSFTWHGRLEGASRGHATFVSTDGVAAGTVFTEDGVYEVGYVGDGEYEIRELDPQAFPTDDPAGDTNPTAPLDTSGSGTTAGDGAGQIDVLVVWTPAAESAAGGSSAIQSVIDLAIANTNTSYANSGITTRVRLVHKAQVAYAENSPSTDLSRITSTSDGYMDAVHALRDQYGADMVSLVGAGYTAQGACGIGYLMTSVGSWFAGNAFTVVDWSCAAGNLTLAHELGHNQGMHHDPAVTSSPGSYSYSYGYVDPSCAFRTVMAYGGCSRATQFSNPAVSLNGRVTGTSTQNNALTLNNNAATVANFRQAVVSGSTTCSYTLSAASLSAPSGGTTGSVSVTAGSGCGWTAVSNASWIGITSGASGSGNGTVGFSVAVNTSTSQRTGTITIAGQTYTVTQAGASCSYTLSATSFSAPSGGATGSVSVTAGSGCGWTAASNASWIGITSGASGSGSGTVGFSVAANTSTSQRTGTITIGGQTYTVTQAGDSCLATLAPAGLSVGAGGGTYDVSVQVGAACTWTATSNASWAVIAAGAAGSGNGTATVNVTANAETSSRSATLTVGSRTLTISQSGRTPVTVAAPSASRAFPIVAGTTVRWSTTVTGGTSPEVRYVLYDQTRNQWSELRAYGPVLTADWAPSLPGNYVVQVWARDAGSSVPYESWSTSGYVTVAPVTPATLTALTANVTFPVTLGTAITWTAAAASNSTVEYRYVLYSQAANQWTELRPYDTNPAVTWTAPASGTYVVQVWARNVGATVPYETWATTGYFSVTETQGATQSVASLISLTTSVSLPSHVGTSITFTASATGAPSIEYRYVLYNQQLNQWSELRGYSTLAQATWTPTAAGTYVVQVWARAVGSTAAYESWRTTGYFSILP